MICRVCDSEKLEPVIDLGSQPWCNHFLTKEQLGHESFYPLRVVYCLRCAAAQLDYTVEKEVMFADHTYLSGITRTLSDHFLLVAREVDKQFMQNASRKAVLDIGSNDGTQLGHYLRMGYEVQGVESARTPAKIAQKKGINTLHAFFNENTARQLGQTYPVINASGIFFHLEELHSAAEGVKLCLGDNGVFIVQFLYMKSIVENGAFDQIYHEHLLYYTLQTLAKLLDRHGLELFDAYLAPIHGGSMIAFASHSERHPRTERLRRLIEEEVTSGCNKIEFYQDFARRIELMRTDNVAYLEAKQAAGLRVYGLGAPVKGNTLLNYFKIGPETIEVLLEKNPLRRGLYSPGMHIPVVMESEWTTIPDVYYVLAWNFKGEILENYANLVEKGVEFYFPIQPPAG